MGEQRWTICVWSECGHRQWGLYEGAEGKCPECGREGKSQEVEVVAEQRITELERERDEAEVARAKAREHWMARTEKAERWRDEHEKAKRVVQLQLSEANARIEAVREWAGKWANAAPRDAASFANANAARRVLAILDGSEGESDG